MRSILHSMYPNTTEQYVYDILILRLLATPVSSTLWRIHNNAESWVQGISPHYTDRYFLNQSRKYLWFQAPQDLAAELLSVHFKRLTLPEASQSKNSLIHEGNLIKNNSSEHKSLLTWEPKYDKSLIKYSLFTDLEDSPKDLNDTWANESPILDDLYLSTLRQEMTSDILCQIQIYPEVVKRVMYFTQGVHNPLERREAQVLKSMFPNLTYVRRE